MDMTIEGKHMVFPHIHETFCSTGVEHDDIRPSEITVLEDFENLTSNAIEGIEVKREDARAMMRPLSLGATPMNWTATAIPTIFSFFIVINQT